MGKLTLTLVPLLLLACGKEPVAPEMAGKAATGLAASLDGLACHAVEGALDQVVTSPDVLEGTISGDVEGNVVTVAGPIDARGAVFTRPGEQTWEITGGIVGPLIGQTIKFEVEVLATTAQAPALGVNTKARVVEGAKVGNLTYHGTTNVATATSHLEYHGVICP